MRKITKDEWDHLEWLHIYGQYTYHADAMIRGTREGLTRLRDAIELALQEGTAKAIVIASDGEGYHTEVVCVSTHTLLGSPEYVHETHGKLMAEEASRAREFGLRDPYGSYKRVD